ncbi:porin family protein [Flavobacterium psychrotolerans]|uniref:PorT family protein n=1 Tax=Flavobacterium psychrotolerans TaxID=2169410 RepID=A0A2U1JI31_9FLAO|nr:porin family protein [Flavobacterium psychrotolerans]PWA04787.1 PorT family protein [Flavobacterium psychrotolerans]
MKTILRSIAVLFTIFATTSGFSQTAGTTSDDTRYDFKIGVKAGLNVSNVYDEQNNDYVAENKVGFVGGGFLSIPITKFVGFQPEILYSEKGFKATKSTILGNYEFTRTSTYLDIPLQLQIKPIPFVTILAGPQFSYLLKTKNDFNGNITSTEEENINSENYKKNIFGFVVGADVNVNNFIISGRAGWDISKTDTNGDSSKPRYKNQVLQVTLGYAF